MNMEMVKNLMNEVSWGTLATTDGEKVGARPMGGWAWIEKELWTATYRATEKVAHLLKVPFAEYCFGNKEGLHVRIAGRCRISEDNADKLRLYNAKPLLKNFISDPGSPEYVIIRMKPESIRIMGSSDRAYKDIKPE